MPAEHHSEPVKSQTDIPEDEIELIDLLRVIWKWKYVIIGATFVFVLAAVVISLIMPKIYSIDTILEPGILNIINKGENEDKRIYIDSPQNLKALIDVGSFDNQILKDLGQPTDSKDIPREIKFKTSIPKQSNTLKVSYETSNVEQGLKILGNLNKLLLEKYNKLIQYYKKDFDGKVQLKTSKVSELTNQISKVKNQILTTKVKYDNMVTAIDTKTFKIQAQVEKVQNNISIAELVHSGRIKQNNSTISKLANQILKVQNNISTTEVEYSRRLKSNNSKILKIANHILKVRNDIANIKSDTEAVIKQKSNKIDTIKASEEAKKNLIKSLQKRINDIEYEIVRVNKNTDFLIEERNKLLASAKDENNILSSVMYINTIQQNIAYLDSLKNRINTINNQIFQERASIERLENDIRDLDIQKENLVIQTNYRTDNFKSQINNLENDIKDLEGQNEDLIKEKVLKIENLKSRINNLENDIKDLKGQNEDLKIEKILKIENFQSQINNHETENKELASRRENLNKQKEYEVATLFSQINDLESQRKYISEEIKILEFKKDNVQSIQILKPPTKSPDPIKPKKKLIAILATFIGIFIMVFLSFLLEYISKNKVQKLSAG